MGYVALVMALCRTESILIGECLCLMFARYYSFRWCNPFQENVVAMTTEKREMGKNFIAASICILFKELFGELKAH